MPERRLEIEARLQCPVCRGVPFLLYRRETRPDSGIFENVLWPNTDTPSPVRINPPASATLTCPADGAVLVRVAA